jgi:hypothetical protein
MAPALRPRDEQQMMMGDRSLDHLIRPLQLTTGIAIARPVTRRLAPFVELTTVTNITAHQGVDERLVGRPQVYVGPGLNIRIRPGLDFVLGIQAPLSDARAFNVGGRAGLVVDF